MHGTLPLLPGMRRPHFASALPDFYDWNFDSDAEGWLNLTTGLPLAWASGAVTIVANQTGYVDSTGLTSIQAGDSIEVRGFFSAATNLLIWNGTAFVAIFNSAVSGTWYSYTVPGGWAGRVGASRGANRTLNSFHIRKV